MKNKIKSVVSSLLTVALLFSALIGVFPMRAAAARAAVTATAEERTAVEIKKIVDATRDYAYDSAQECLEAELMAGYLDGVVSADRSYSIYVNRYTGMLYYRNNLTGQILTSNPYQFTGQSKNSIAELMSQISVEFSLSDRIGEKRTYNSYEWAAAYAQIATYFIENGIRVSYTIGDTTSRFFLPGRITRESFENYFLVPMITQFEQIIMERFPETGMTFFNNEVEGEYKPYDAYVDGCINTSASTSVKTRYYGDGTSEKIGPGLRAYLTKMQALYYPLSGTDPDRIALVQLTSDINTILNCFSVINLREFENQPAQEKTYEEYKEKYYSDPSLEIYETLEPFYAYTSTGSVTADRLNAKLLLRYAESYADHHDGETFTFEMLRDEEKRLGYEAAIEQKPVFRCSLEYTFDRDGTLLVRLPANSISFDETAYHLESITPLQFFGAADMRESGQIFFPDGSGTIIDFDGFRSANIAMTGSGSVFGPDRCYSFVTGVHHEQITLPVYGVVGYSGTNADTVAKGLSTDAKNRGGYFAILEEGQALASLYYQTGGLVHRYATAYASFNPYPSDFILLSTTGTGGTYKIVSESKYSGAYVTRYVMLSDDTVGTRAYGAGNYYPATYTGMANCYREYLVETGVLSAIDDLSADIPLYIESLGAIEIQAKFLSFPITKKIALTSFENVQMMYDDLSSEGVGNINFRLTGFSNGGMSYTYPTRLRWERVVGGRSGFKKLISYAAQVSEQEGKTFGIYPDFDFAYIHNTALFDGVSLKGTVSRRVDNRYAGRPLKSDTSSGAVMQSGAKGSAKSGTATGASRTAKRLLVVSPDILSGIFAGFAKRYGKYDVNTISVSTLASELNSNFDPKQSVNRHEAQNYIGALLQQINDAGYSVMSDTGNVYAVQFARHLLRVPIDSSHFRYSSYAVPFVGMILHGHVHYAGNPINYAGTIEYEMLRAIESGASLYYILCYENSAHMKDNSLLSSYYGVDYKTWRDEVIATYKELNGLLRDLQTWQIVGHEIILGERVIEDRETVENYNTLKQEFLDNVNNQLYAAINEKYVAMRQAGTVKPLGVSIARDELIDKLAVALKLTDEQKQSILTGDESFLAAFDELIASYQADFTGTEEILTFSAEDFSYETTYSYITDSDAQASDYSRTDYTSDLNNIVLVTYSNGTDSVRFILNYNIYSVVVRLDGNAYTIPKFGYQKIN